MPSAVNVPTGYTYANEKDLEAYSALQVPMFAANIREEDLPREVDPRKWHRIEDQGSQGSCQGHMLSSICEGLYFIETGDSTIQLSRNGAYRWSQIEDGIRGDQGSTLEGGIRAAKKGLCLEKFFPYTSQYAPVIPREAEQNRTFKLVTHGKIPKESGAHELAHMILGQGLHLIGFGMKWTDEMDKQSKIMKYTGRGRGGGHAVAILGYLFIDGDLYFVLANSWGTKFWGDKGYKLVHYKAFDQIVRYGWNVTFSYSDLDGFDVPRTYPDLSIILDILK